MSVLTYWRIKASTANRPLSLVWISCYVAISSNEAEDSLAFPSDPYIRNFPELISALHQEAAIYEWLSRKDGKSSLTCCRRGVFLLGQLQSTTARTVVRVAVVVLLLLKCALRSIVNCIPYKLHLSDCVLAAWLVLDWFSLSYHLTLPRFRLLARKFLRLISLLIRFIPAGLRITEGHFHP